MKNLITFALVISFSVSGFAQTPGDFVKKDKAETASNDYVGSPYMYVSVASLFFATMALNARDSLARKGEIAKAQSQQTIALGSMGVCLVTNLLYAAKAYWPSDWAESN